MTDLYEQDQGVLLDKINNAISDSIYIYDLNEKNLTWLNKRAQERYGYTLEELRQMGPSYQEQMIHADDQKTLQDSIQKSRSLKDGEVLTFEYRLKDSQNKYHWLNDRVTVFSRNDKGEVVSILGVATDVNERKAVEEDQKKVIEKLNLSLSAAKMGTWEWDIESNQLTWDRRMYEIHGVEVDPALNPMEEVWRRSFREDMEQTNIKVSEAAEKKQDFYVTYRVTHDNQEVHHVRCYGKFMHNDPTINRMYGVAWDSTEEFMTERQIEEAKAKLISAAKMAALGEMSGGIAHEINNPLTVIQARAFQLAQMVDMEKVDAVKVKQAAESISRTADKIARIIKSLRSFAREGTYDPFEVVPLKAMIEETLEFCRMRFYNHGVEIEVSPIDTDLEIECRLVQLEQVLLNLLNNSFDAIQHLDNKWIRISVKEHIDSVQIIVADSGHGIPDEIADQIMLPFFTTKEVGKGTGLGLSISAGILRSHKGSLTLLKEAPNTTFVVSLPKWQEDEALNY